MRIYSFFSFSRQMLFVVLIGIVGGSCFYTLQPSTEVKAQERAQILNFKGHHLLHWGKRKQAPTNGTCISDSQIACYSPQELQNAYNFTSVLNAGYTGKGQTIVIVDSFGSPTITQDLRQFDRDYHLPDPPSFQVMAPFGIVPFDTKNDDQVGWAEETSLDVEWAHAMAPGANIVLLTSPVSETQGVQGMPQFLALEVYAVQHNLGQIISQSWGTTENTLFTTAGSVILNGFNDFYKEAARRHITIFASAGDSGAANVDTRGNTYPYPTVEFPASSPWVTAIGGTTLQTATNGLYQAEAAWQSSGGGVSRYFRMSDYQRNSLGVADLALLKNRRGVPDVAFNADPNSGVPVYLSFLPGDQVGYWIFGGTSLGSPVWSGLVADANQVLGHPVGFLNNQLYQLGNHAQQGAHAAISVFHDITSGDNSLSGVTGYQTTVGWDPVTGWGTPLGAPLINALH